MRRDFAPAFAFLFTGAFVSAQQAAAPAPPHAPNSSSPAAEIQPLTETAYYAGPGVTAPELIPLSLEEISTGECDKLNGVATLTAVVDAQGVPVQILFLRPAGNGADKMAAHVLSLDRFKPGTHDGAPVATVIADEIKVQTCIERSNAAGKKVTTLHLRSVPDQKVTLVKSPGRDATVPFVDGPPSSSEDGAATEFGVGSGVTPPRVIRSAPAEFSDYARSNHINGACLITLIVDEHGLPQDERIVRSLEPSLDQNALKAVSQYRFKPAMKNGVPVPYRITIEVEFHIG